MATDRSDAAKVRERGWYVWDYEAGGVVRGPYPHPTTAGAVRSEMERGGDERNLWIVPSSTVTRWEAELVR